MNPAETALQTPFLLFILCALSAMAFAISAFRWFIYAIKNDIPPPYSYAHMVWSGQGRAFTFGLLVSLFVAAYVFMIQKQSVNIVVELFILCGVSFYLMYRMGVSYTIKAALSVLTMGVMILCGWLVTVGLGYLLFVVIKNITVVNSSEFVIVIVFLVGLLWNLPIYIMYRRILKNREKRSVLSGRRVHQFLWPILFAYIVLIFPLISEQVLRSDEWRAMKYEKNVSSL